MKPTHPPSTALPIRPSVMAAMLYFGLGAVWFIWIFLAAEHPFRGTTDPFRLITPGQYGVVSFLNLAFTLVIGIDTWGRGRSPLGLRKAHLAGAVLALVGLVMIQLAAHYAYGPVQADGALHGQ